MVKGWIWVVAAIVVLLLIIVVVRLEKRYPVAKIKLPSKIGWLVVTVMAFGSSLFWNNQGSVINAVMTGMGDQAMFYNQLTGARINGPLIQFMNNLDVKVMNEPSGYSKAKMAAIAKRYQKEARRINQTRQNDLAKQNIIFNLSESFSDPRRVPGIKLAHDPMPNIERLKQNNTSGLMISSGYGGGTANMEYQALTGLSIVNFSPTMPTPYSQLVPYQKRAVSINQLFSYSDGIHPFTANLYSRVKVYRKFGFNRFYHLDGGSRLSYTHKIDNSPRIDDWSAYQQVLLNLRNHHGNQFIQLATMQNHMPYDNFYHHNNYKVSGTAYRTPQAQQQIETYTQGIHYTDEALKKFISRLDQSSQPTTVVWYGDHLPGIYNGVSMAEHGLVMHETDYFIYSNPAAQKINHSRVDKAKIVSPNEFIPMAMAQMDLKVSPYYALLTQVHEKLPAITLDPNVHSHSNRPHSTAAEYVDQDGLADDAFSKADAAV